MLMGRRVYPTTLVSLFPGEIPAERLHLAMEKHLLNQPHRSENSLLHRWQNDFRLGNQPKSAWAKAGRNQKCTGDEDATLSGPSNVQCVFLGTFEFAVLIHCHQSYNDTSLYPGCFQDAHQIHLMIFVHMFFLLIHPRKGKTQPSHVGHASSGETFFSTWGTWIRGCSTTKRYRGMAFHDFMTLAPGNPWKTPIICDQREKHKQNRRCKAFFLAPPDLQPPWTTCYKLQDHEKAKRSARCVFFASEKLLANTCKPSGAIHLSRPKDQGFGQRMQWTLPLP